MQLNFMFRMSFRLLFLIMCLISALTDSNARSITAESTADLNYVTTGFYNSTQETEATTDLDYDISRFADMTEISTTTSAPSSTDPNGFCDDLDSPFDSSDMRTWPLNNVTGRNDFQLTEGQLEIGPGNEQVSDYIVRKHNCLRTTSSPPAANMLQMVWNEEVAQQAQAWADNCEYGHNSAENRTTSKFACGQNIASSWPRAYSWNIIINLWFNEVNRYVYGGISTDLVVGHYTQIMWASTFQIGCGYRYCTAPKDRKPFHYYVCNYGPSGNVHIRGQSQAELPYQVGSACSACPGDCKKSQLCGLDSSCPYADTVSNCNTLKEKNRACTPRNPFGNLCKATCLCQGKIFLSHN